MVLMNPQIITTRWNATDDEMEGFDPLDYNDPTNNDKQSDRSILPQVVILVAI